MGGTGLEPVTPSLSRRPLVSRPLAGASEFLLPCRAFTLKRQAAFAPACTLSLGLVVARGSTVGRVLRRRTLGAALLLTLIPAALAIPAIAALVLIATVSVAVVAYEAIGRREYRAELRRPQTGQ